MGKSGKSKKKSNARFSNSKARTNDFTIGCEHFRAGLDIKKLMHELTRIERCCETCPIFTDSAEEKENDSCNNQSSESDNGENCQHFPNIWLCLCCARRGCSRHEKGHALGHFERQPSHAVALSLTDFYCWCYKCDNEVDISTGHPIVDYILSLKKRLSSFSESTEEEESSSSSDHVKITEHIKQTSKKGSAANSAAQMKQCNVKGLANIGNTCFFNSVLQCLFHSSHMEKTLSTWIYSSNYSIPCLIDDEQSSRTVPVPSAEKCLMTNALNDLFGEMNSSKTPLIYPNNLFNQICAKVSRFRGYQQQDAHELLRHLLDTVKSEELSRVKSAIVEKSLPKSNKTIEEAATFKRVMDVIGNSTLVDTYFGGEIIDTIVCLECHSINTVLQHFLDISLPLRKPVANSDPVKTRITDKALRAKLRKERKQQRKAQECMGDDWGNNDDGDEEVQRVLAMSMESGIASQSTIERPDSGLGSGSSGSDPVDTSAFDVFPNNSSPSHGDEVMDENLLASIAALHVSTRQSYPSSQRMSNKELKKRLQTLGNRPPPEDVEKSVYSALYWYTEREDLKNENRYACEQCQQKHGNKNYLTEGTKQTLIAKPPKILTLHLKRFQQVESRRSTILQKIGEHVDFPAELDIAPFLSREAIVRHWKEAEVLAAEDSLPHSIFYSLRAVVEHSGSLNGGHYIAHVRPRRGEGCSVEDEWFTISDGHVRNVSLDNVLRSNAYLLFYELDMKV